MKTVVANWHGERAEQRAGCVFSGFVIALDDTRLSLYRMKKENDPAND